MSKNTKADENVPKKLSEMTEDQFGPIEVEDLSTSNYFDSLEEELKEIKVNESKLDGYRKEYSKYQNMGQFGFTKLAQLNKQFNRSIQEGPEEEFKKIMEKHNAVLLGSGAFGIAYLIYENEDDKENGRVYKFLKDYRDPENSPQRIANKWKQFFSYKKNPLGLQKLQNAYSINKSILCTPFVNGEAPINIELKKIGAVFLSNNGDTPLTKSEEYLYTHSTLLEQNLFIEDYNVKGNIKEITLPNTQEKYLAILDFDHVLSFAGPMSPRSSSLNKKFKEPVTKFTVHITKEFIKPALLKKLESIDKPNSIITRQIEEIKASADLKAPLFKILHDLIMKRHAKDNTVLKSLLDQNDENHNKHLNSLITEFINISKDYKARLFIGDVNKYKDKVLEGDYIFDKNSKKLYCTNKNVGLKTIKCDDIKALEPYANKLKYGSEDIKYLSPQNTRYIRNYIIHSSLKLIAKFKPDKQSALKKYKSVKQTAIKKPKFFKNTDLQKEQAEHKTTRKLKLTFKP